LVAVGTVVRVVEEAEGEEVVVVGSEDQGGNA
jgi:hypothetical protein